MQSRPHCIDEWVKFDAKAYLRAYYGHVGPENRALLGFLLKAFRDMPEDNLMLEFGGGPTIYSLITACTRLREAHFCDYLDSNLEEVRMWLRGDPSAFDWTPFVQTALELEKNDTICPRQICLREEKIRRFVTKVLRADAGKTRPLGHGTDIYDVIVSNFCIDSAARTRAECIDYVRNILSMLRPGGRLILSALEGAVCYPVGKVAFSAVPLTKDDLQEVLLSAGCERSTLVLDRVEAETMEHGYRGLLFSCSVKR